MRYRLDVVTTNVPEVVKFAGGWLVDRVMATRRPWPWPRSSSPPTRECAKACSTHSNTA
jgi:hypothetical protein